MKITNYKKIFNVLLLVSTIIILASCSDFLNEEPYGFSSSDELYTTGPNAELALTGVYDIINASNIQGQGNQNMWGRGLHYLAMLGDDAVPNLPGIPDADHSVIASCAYNSESEFVKMAWFGLFIGIDRANHIIQKVPNIDMDQTRRNEIVAEAKFFRGYYRLYLAFLFGEVPLPNEPNSDPKESRKPLDQVYAQIEKDLTDAYNILPARNAKPGRINKWTAAGYLVKMYTYLGGCKENNVGKDLNSSLNNFDWVNANDMYTKAFNIAKDLYDNSGYKMIAPYNYAFLADTKKFQKDECLMLAQTGVGGNNEYFLFSYWASPQGNVGANGGGYAWIRPTGELCSKYNANDYRFKWNITGNVTSTEFSTINGVKYFSTIPVNSTGGNLCFGKLRQSDPALRIAQGIPTWASNIDFPLLRHADIVLLYAEMKFKKNDEAGARALLSEVRQRACTSIDGTIDNATLSELNTAYYNANFMQELMDERMRELCIEGWRRFDLIRWGKMTTTINNITTTTIPTDRYYAFNPSMKTIKENYAPYKIWFPIPKREIETNRSLVQNLGYND